MKHFEGMTDLKRREKKMKVANENKIKILIYWKWHSKQNKIRKISHYFYQSLHEKHEKNKLDSNGSNTRI